MLTAAAHKKIKRKLDLHEDEITSCIFGAMQHLPINIVRDFFIRMAKEAAIQKPLFTDLPDKAVFEFWPKWKTDIKYVEPDVVIHFYKEESPLLRVIVEVKWNAPLSPQCELIRQWNHRLPRKHETNPIDVPWIHLYLVKNDASGRQDIKKTHSMDEEFCREKCSRCEDKARIISYMGQKIATDDEWQERLGCIGWRHIVVAAKGLTQREPTWGKGVSNFFAKQGIVPFTGFEWLCEENIYEMSPDEEMFFYRDPWFAFLNDIEISDNETETAFSGLMKFNN
jgi:hypothetical protein